MYIVHKIVGAMMMVQCYKVEREVQGGVRRGGVFWRLEYDWGCAKVLWDGSGLEVISEYEKWK